MLPASPTSPAPQRANTNTDRILTGLIVASMLYTLLLGWGVLASIVSFQSVYLLMAPPCVAPIAWYGYGFLKINGTTKDFGLVLSALGWGLVAISFLVRYAALNADLQAYQAGSTTVDPARLGDSTSAMIFAVGGMICLVLGAVMSFQAWSREMRRNTTY